MNHERGPKLSVFKNLGLTLRLNAHVFSDKVLPHKGIKSNEMVSSPALEQLCCEVVEEYYGTFFRAIFQTLCQDGRLKATQIAQKCHLPLRQAQLGLASLIQLKLINHHGVGDSPATYSPNLHNVYDIIRFGQLIQASFTRHGELAANIVELVCRNGFATVGEVRDRIISDGHPQSHLAEDCIQNLLDDGFLVHIRSAQFRDPHDAQRDVEFANTSLAVIAKLTGTKAKQEHAAKVAADYERVVSTKGQEAGYVSQAFASEARKMLNGTGMTTSSGQHNAHTTTLVQVNTQKAVSIVQGQRLLEICSNHCDEVRDTILKFLIEQASSCDRWSKQNLDDLFAVNCAALAEALNVEKLKTHEIQRDKPTTNGHTDWQRNGSTKMSDVQRHMVTLAEGPFRTFLYTGNVGSEWLLNRNELKSFLQREETLDVMISRLEDPAPRILRILVEKGKLEEKTLQEIALLGAKELRQCLSLLKQIGCLDLQEVPRNQQRQPNHTVFLWFYDNSRTSYLALESIYATMKRLIQFLRDQRRDVASTITKFEGRDMTLPVEPGLEEVEYNVYRRYRKLETWVWAEISRLDSTVAVLRDC